VLSLPFTFESIKINGYEDNYSNTLPVDGGLPATAVTKISHLVLMDG